jgi:hypothetical protein
LRRSAAAFAFVVSVPLTLRADPAWAQEGIFAGMQKSLEFTSSSVSTTITSGSGAATTTDTRNLFPALTLNLNALVYPGLRLNTGGVFELSKVRTTTNDIKTNSTTTRNRPFFLLQSTNQVFAPGIGYFRREALSRSEGLSDVKLVNDERAGYLAWRPAGGPQSDFQFLKTRTFDGARAFQDVSKDLGSLTSLYRSGSLAVSYRGSYLKTDDRIGGLKTRQVSHGARGDYSHSFLKNRLRWNAAFNVTRQDLETAAQGNGGEVALPVTPFAGLSSTSDTPLTSTLSQNGGLVDATLTAGAGINLGLPATPADAQSRNIGIDLLTPTEVNQFLVWVDRELPAEVARSFSWEIYSSPDNLIWTREATVSAAPFGPFENRFQIDFPGITARYVKVVTRPLSAVVPDSSRFRDILVTEMQVFVRRSADEVGGRLTRTTDLLNTDVRFRILDAPALYYEGFFLSNGTGGSAARTDTLSNGVSMNHTFGRIFSAVGRLAREQGTEPRGERTATLTSATLTVDPISTFRTSFLYSGQDETIEGIPNARSGWFIQNAAQPYRGVDVLFGFGWTSATRETGEISNDRLVNVSATIVPRQHLSLTFSHDERTTERSGIFFGPPRSLLRRSYASVAVDPIPTFHLVVGGEVIVATGQATRTTLDINASWAPFPDGTLQFVFASNEALRALEFGTERNTLGAVRWNLSRQSYIDVSYQRTRSEFVNLRTESRILSARVRLFL